MKSQSLKNLFILKDLKETLSRFQLPASCSIMTTIIIFTIIIFENSIFHYKEIIPMIMIINIATNLLTALKIYAESHKWSNKKYLIASITSIIAIFIIRIDSFLYDINLHIFISFIAINFGFLLSISFAPFINHKNNNIPYCNFSCNITNGILISSIAATILCIGILSIFATMSYLLDINIDPRFFLLSGSICFSLFCPLYFLSTIDKSFLQNVQKEYPRSLKFITNYILIPTILAYLIILYLYIIKIIITQQLPKGTLGWIITCFGCFGVLTYLFAYPLWQNHKNRFIELFLKYFFHLLIIPVILLFIAINQRINQFGITEKRYLVLALGSWLTISCLHHIITKGKNLKFIAISLSTILILSSFGPWGMFNVSTISQTKRLKTILEKEGLIINNQIISSVDIKKINIISFNEIKEIIRYLARTNKLQNIKIWFPQHSYIQSIKHTNNYNSINQEKIMEDMRIDVVNNKKHSSNYATFKEDMRIDVVNNKKHSSNYATFKNKRYDNLMFDVRNFDFLINFSLYKSHPDKNFYSIKSDKNIDIKLENNQLVIKNHKNNLTSNIDLKKFVSIKQIESLNNLDEETKKYFTIEHKDNEKHLIINARSVSIHQIDNNSFIENIEGSISIKFFDDIR